MMRWMFAAALLLAGFGTAQAQDALPRDEALKAAFQLCRDLPKMLATPISTDPDVKRPVGLQASNRGLLIFPECKLNTADFSKTTPDAMPIGQVWLLKIVPTVAGQPAKADTLQMLSFESDRGLVDVALCALAVRKGADGRPELLIYGKDKEPLLHVPLTAITDKQENPIEVSGQQQGSGATVTLKIAGSYSASFAVEASE